MSNARRYDVAVIGGGPIGLSTAYHLSKRGVSTLVLEQFNFLNQQGSSAGVSRQFRIPYPERYMVRLAVETMPYWDELQALTPIPLLDKVGTLWFGDPTVHTSEGNIAEAMQAMDAEKVSYELLKVQQLQDRYHFCNLPGHYTGLFQPDGASINLAATADVLLKWATASPSVTLQNECPLTGVSRASDGFQLKTPQGSFSANKLVLTPGPYANSVFHLLGFHIEATYWNMTSAFYKIKNPALRFPTWFAFQEPDGANGNEFYGFPEVSWNHPGYVRVASDFVVKPLSAPGQRTFVPNEQELAFTSDWVQDHMAGLDTEPAFISTCLVALSKIPNKEILIDFAPQYVPNSGDVVLCATGWAAKFIPSLGKILSDLALDGKTCFDISQFRTSDIYLTQVTTPIIAAESTPAAQNS